jgi:hypothetical protein
LLSLLDDQSQPIVTALLTSDGQLAIGFDQLGKVRSTLALSPRAWHEIQLHLLLSGETGWLEVWLDGQLVKSVELSVLDRPITAIQLGEPRGDRSFQVYFDDMVVDERCVGTCSTELVTATAVTSATTEASVTATVGTEPSESPTVEATPPATDTPAVPEPSATPEPTMTPAPAETPLPPPTETPPPEPTPVPTEPTTGEGAGESGEAGV